MSVAMLTDYYPPHIGGIEQVVQELVLRLIERNHPVELATYSANVGSTGGAKLTTMRGMQLQRFLGVPSTVPTEVRWHKRVGAADIVHAHNFYFSTTQFAPRVARDRKAKAIITAHLGTMSQMGGVAGPIARVLERRFVPRVASRFDVIIAVSNSVAESLVANKVDRARIHVIPNGVDTKTFHPGRGPVDPKHVVFAGRMASNKGAPITLEVVPEVLKEVPDARFTIAGGGPLLPQLRARARKLGVTHAVSLPGRVDSVADVLRTGAIYVRPSLSEGMPLGVLEAMATGMYIVGSDIDGIRDLVTEGGCGTLVPPHDADALAGALVAALEDPQTTEVRGKMGQLLAQQHYGWETVVDQTVRLYSEIGGHSA